MQWIEKDLRYAKDMAASYGVSFDLLDATQKDFADAKRAGLGAEDQTKLFSQYRDSAD